MHHDMAVDFREADKRPLFKVQITFDVEPLAEHASPGRSSRATLQLKDEAVRYGRRVAEMSATEQVRGRLSRSVSSSERFRCLARL